MPWLRETNPYRCARHAEKLMTLRQETRSSHLGACDVSRGLERVPVTWTTLGHKSDSAPASTDAEMALGAHTIIPVAGDAYDNGNDETPAASAATSDTGGQSNERIMLPSGWTYAVEPVYDPEVSVLGKSVTELTSDCIAHRAYYSKAGCLRLDREVYMPTIVECSLASTCHMSCAGRLVGRGLAAALQIFKIGEPPKPARQRCAVPKEQHFTKEARQKIGRACFLYPPYADAPRLEAGRDATKSNRVGGWGVRTALHQTPLPRGAFVAEFIGRVSSVNRCDVAAAIAAGDNRVACVKDWLPQSPGCLDCSDESEGSGLCLDARSVGNVARFIRFAIRSRGEKPNLMKQAVFTNQHNPSLPRLAFFAANRIEPGEELLR